MTAALPRKTLTGLRPPRAQARLFCSVFLTLSLHGAALLMLATLGHRGAGLRPADNGLPSPVHLRLAHVPPADTVGISILALAQQPAAQWVDGSSQAERDGAERAISKPATNTDSNADFAPPPIAASQAPWPTEALDAEPQALEGGLNIEHPDAPLPDGQAEVMLALRLDEAGMIEEVGMQGRDTLPTAFSNAIEAALLRQTLFNPGQRQGQTARSGLCLTVRFQEGQRPSWELLTQKPSASGRCTEQAERLEPSTR